MASYRARWNFCRTLLVVLSIVFLAACKTELHSGLTEQDANEMMSRLLVEGINVSKKSDKDGVTLLVDQAQFGEAVDKLRSHGLPRRPFSTMGDVFAEQGLIASPLQEWARFNFAKAQELSQSISSIPGVLHADVHIASTRRQSAFETVSPPSASVLIQIHEDRITPDLVPQIKQMISFSIPDIEYDRVGVILSPVVRAEARLELVTMYGIMIHPASVPRMQSALLAIAGGALLVLLALSGVVFSLLRKRRHPEVAQ